MQKIGFEEAVEKIRRQDDRYDPDAYAFLKDALDYSVRAKQEKVGEEYPHVGGGELLQGFKDLALDEFGPMAATVLEVWGVTCSEDVGEMVFQLIEMGAFGKSDDDSRDDFKEVFSFDEAFCEPFRPQRRSQSRSDAKTVEDNSEVRIQKEGDISRKSEVRNKKRSDAKTAEGNSES